MPGGPDIGATTGVSRVFAFAYFCPPNPPLMHFRLLLSLLFFGCCLSAQPVGHRITVDIDGYQEDILTLGHYLLDNQYIIDTARREASAALRLPAIRPPFPPACTWSYWPPTTSSFRS